MWSWLFNVSMKKLFILLLVSAVGFLAYSYMIVTPLGDQVKQEINSFLQKKMGSRIGSVSSDSASSNTADSALTDSAPELLKKFNQMVTPSASHTNAQSKSKSITFSSAAPLAMSSYKGRELPEQSVYMDAPIRSGHGDLKIDNLYSGMPIVVEFLENNQVIASAYVQKEEVFIAKNLPNIPLSLSLIDIRNGQITPTRRFATDQKIKITPYLSTLGGGSLLMYRAESQILKRVQTQ